MRQGFPVPPVVPECRPQQARVNDWLRDEYLPFAVAWPTPVVQTVSTPQGHSRIRAIGGRTHGVEILPHRYPALLVSAAGARAGGPPTLHVFAPAIFVTPV